MNLYRIEHCKLDTLTRDNWNVYYVRDMSRVVAETTLVRLRRQHPDYVFRVVKER